MNRLARFLATSLLAAMGFISGGPANAGPIIISGTDAMSLHGDLDFINPVLDTLQGASSLNVLVIGGSPINGNGVAVGVGLTYGGATLGSEVLANFSAIIFESPCCSDPAFRLGTRAADVASFVAGGGGLYIEDYQGLAAWDSILGIAPGAGAASMVDSLTCIDPGVSTASGIAFGFAASYSEGCFVHQSYTGSFWAGEGYFALQTKTDTTKWVTMASGFQDPGSVPEPSSVALCGLALLALGARRRASTARA